jgi:aromatic ring-cleaving dioxygenase
MKPLDTWLRNGYDIHVVFLPAQQAEAQAMMDAFLAFVDSRDIPYERPILFEAPVGPWTTPMWQILLLQPDPEGLSRSLGDCVGWLMANHGPFSVMVHPNSVDGGRIDHTENAFWLGPPTPLRLEIFS